MCIRIEKLTNHVSNAILLRTRRVIGQVSIPIRGTSGLEASHI